MIEIIPLTGIGEIAPGADLAAVIGDALGKSGWRPRPGDILVVTQKIVSKSENRFVDLADIVPGPEASRLAAIARKDPRLVELVCRESSEIIRVAPHVLITRHRCGFVMANAGIDRSNLGNGSADRVLLLPVDADVSAERLRQGLSSRLGDAPAIVISDSFGRPWRHGVVCVAIGASGMPSLVDRRGERDRDGRILEVTQVALGDMVATAAGLATGEGAEGVPAALVRGLSWHGSSPASALIRPPEEDLFR